LLLPYAVKLLVDGGLASFRPAPRPEERLLKIREHFLLLFVRLWSWAWRPLHASTW
jgi:hypothetical protein